MGRGSQKGRVMRIVLVDDQELIRFSIRSVLAREEDIEIVGEASTGRESLDLCRRLKPDLVLMDIEMPEMDGIEATWRIKEDLPETSVLMLTYQDAPDYLLEAIQAGAAGYVLKENALFQITSAIRSGGSSPLNRGQAAHAASTSHLGRLPRPTWVSQPVAHTSSTTLRSTNDDPSVPLPGPECSAPTSHRAGLFSRAPSAYFRASSRSCSKYLPATSPPQASPSASPARERATSPASRERKVACSRSI